MRQVRSIYKVGNGQIKVATDLLRPYISSWPLNEINVRVQV